MGGVVLDTSVIVAIERGHAHLPSFAHVDDHLAVAAVTVAELLSGAEQGHPSRRSDRRAQVEDFLGALAVLPYGEHEARIHAELIAHATTTGRPRGAHDLIIAATARAHGRTVVTLDRRGFASLPGVEVRGELPRDGPQST